MPHMVRIYYLGDEVTSDERLAGVLVRPGCAVDVTEDLAGTLEREGTWSREPRSFVEIRQEPETRPARRTSQRRKSRKAESKPGALDE